MAISTSDASGSTTRPQTFYLLEVLRFNASIAVILYHYQHFITYSGNAYDPAAIPFNSTFGWFYRNGGLGVQIFWCLSGVVFAHVYQVSIALRDETMTGFFRKRVARLYPLHLATLLIVAALIWVVQLTTQFSSFVYQFNDVRHFLLNLGFVQYWGFQSGTSFNGPSWSISIEIIAYGSFVGVVLLMRLIQRSQISHHVFLVVWFMVLVAVKSQTESGPGFVTKCVFLFFLGSLTYSVWITSPRRLIAVIALVCVVDYYKNGPLTRFISPYELPFGPSLLSLLLVLLTCSEWIGGRTLLCAFSTRVGSLTYSMYLLHFPLQMAMILVSENLLRLDFLNPAVFVLFFALLISLSALSHDRFEIPMKSLVLGKRQSN